MCDDPVRLQKQEVETSTMDSICRKICPYVLFICIALLIITVFVIMVKYGANITGTEANQYYNGFRGGL